MRSTVSSFNAAEFRRRAEDHHPDNEIAGPGSTILAHGDHVFNNDLIRGLMDARLREAAVLIPIIDDGDDAKVILTRRTVALRKHSGQVAFPGGAVDADDITPDVAALREAEEEIGLDRGHVEVVGQLPVYLTTTGFRITPVLSIVQPGYSLVANPDEVDAIFDVPLSFLMNPSNHVRESREWEGRMRHYYRMPYGEHDIWGVTAGIIRTLYERLYR